jgi:Putative adhesin
MHFASVNTRGGNMKIGLRAAHYLAVLVCSGLIVCTAIPAAASSEGSFQRTLQVNGPVNLDVSTGSGDIQVHNGSFGQVQVNARIKVSNWFGSDNDERVRRIEQNPPIQQSGNDIRIGHIDDPDLRHNISISYDIAVPAESQVRAHSGSGEQIISGVSGGVEVDAGSGDLKIDNAGGRVRAHTGSGAITLNHIQGNVHAEAGSGDIRGTDIAGGFEAHTGSGRIEVSQSAPGAVSVETGSGDVEARGVHGSLDASTGSGDVRIDGEPTGGWTIHTSSGAVRLKIASSSGFDLDARTSSGSISTTQSVAVQGNLGHKELRGKVNGGGVPVTIRTSSGDIEIQ